MSVNRYLRTREDHTREIAEDYVELIEALIAELGEARIGALAERLGVSHVTVSRTVQRLRREGLATGRRYRSVQLTAAGRKLAADARQRHKLVREFLVAIGVEPGLADVDAEGIEHHVSEETLKAMRRHLDSL
jgi:DtxR family manganese transport transcriptional regulator